MNKMFLCHDPRAGKTYFIGPKTQRFYSVHEGTLSAFFTLAIITLPTLVLGVVRTIDELWHFSGAIINGFMLFLSAIVACVVHIILKRVFEKRYDKRHFAPLYLDESEKKRILRKSMARSKLLLVVTIVLALLFAFSANDFVQTSSFYSYFAATVVLIGLAAFLFAGIKAEINKARYVAKMLE